MSSSTSNANFVGTHERWAIERILQTRQQGKPFLSSKLEAYLELGNFVQLQHPLTVSAAFSSQIGLIVDASPNQLDHHYQFEEARESTYWIQLNWWIPVQHTYTADPPLSHVNLPPEYVRTTNVQWVPETHINDVAFIFHIMDIFHGRYPNTKGLKNVYFCRALWDTVNESPTSAMTHPYYPIFHCNRVESYPDRVWSVIERVQSMFHKVMGRRGDS